MNKTSEDHDSTALITTTSAISEDARKKSAFYNNGKQFIHKKDAAPCQAEVHRNTEPAESLEAKMTELRSILREERINGEREQSDNAIKITELLFLLSEERQNREKLVYQLKKIMRKAAQAVLVEQDESQEQKLNEELYEVRKLLTAAEEMLWQAASLVPNMQQKILEERHHGEFIQGLKQPDDIAE
ncbi:hypothetical protein HPB51_016773 [Rhipicephalus microplus]|uniref:Uncharacterized protein n=1 Tax=Rhipicephalus microplus TaxID=6941 RepID=A0A9J6DWB4_RHIMP|nr:hypothetical protein HPB51_016773 [Rhipicephalus microplus]